MTYLHAERRICGGGGQHSHARQAVGGGGGPGWARGFLQHRAQLIQRHVARLRKRVAKNKVRPQKAAQEMPCPDSQVADNARAY